MKLTKEENPILAKGENNLQDDHERQEVPGSQLSSRLREKLIPVRG
jgi:hypothetical protein